MFTGIVEIVGSKALPYTLPRCRHELTNVAVARLEQLDQTASGGGGTSLTIADAESILGDCHEGDSIAVNGECAHIYGYAADADEE
jgi:riboflavin synthase